MVTFAPRILLACLVSLLGAVSVAANVTYPTNLEFDVVFPRNDSYAPAQMVPVIFAVQNPQAANYLAFQIDWALGRVGTNDTTSGLVDLSWPHYDSDPYYVVRHFWAPNATEGTYILRWELIASNCSDGTMSPYYDSGHNLVYFTLRNGVQELDLVASTASETCASIPSRTFNVTGQLPIQGDSNAYDGRSTCAVLGQPTPAPDPCALAMNSSQASSISAEITASLCAGSSPVLQTGCPTSTQSANSAPQPERSATGLGGSLVSALLGLVVLF